MQVVPGVGGALVEAPEGQRFIGAPQLLHVPQGRQGHGAHAHIALLPQLHHGDGFFVPGFGEGVLQRRSAVADGFPPGGLRVVNVPQGHVVKGGEHRRVHIVAAAHGNILRITPGGTGDELVGHQHGADVGGDGCVLYGRMQGVGIGADGGVREEPPYVGGLEEGQQEDLHRTVGVLQGKGGQRAVVYRGEVDAAAGHEAAAEGHPLRGVVVSADEEYLKMPPGQLHQEFVQQCHCLGGGDGLVVDVSGDEHAVRRLAVRNVQDFFENIALVLQHGKSVDPLAQMQVGEMDELHGKGSFAKDRCILKSHYSPNRSGRQSSARACQGRAGGV